MYSFEGLIEGTGLTPGATPVATPVAFSPSCTTQQQVRFMSQYLPQWYTLLIKCLINIKEIRRISICLNLLLELPIFRYIYIYLRKSTICIYIYIHLTCVKKFLRCCLRCRFRLWSFPVPQIYNTYGFKSRKLYNNFLLLNHIRYGPSSFKYTISLLLYIYYINVCLGHLLVNLIPANAGGWKISFA